MWLRDKVGGMRPKLHKPFCIFASQITQPNKIYLKAQSIHLAGLLSVPTGQQGWSKKEERSQEMQSNAGVSKQ